MPCQIVVGDIVTMRTDAIVNAANSALRPGSGVCGAIFRAAGCGDMDAACRGIGFCAVGDAVITPGFALPAPYVIHTVGPVWQGGRRGEEALLRSAYISSLTLAHEYGLSSISFPLISSGVFGYPKAQALAVARGAIADFLSGREMDVYLVLLNRDALSAGID